jgi:hypothetical protein
MTVGDIYYVQTSCSTNNRNWTFGNWLKETVDYSEPNNAQPIADTVFLTFSVALRPVLAVDSHLEGVSVWKRHLGSSRPGQVLASAGEGARPGRSMSNDNSLFINLRQDTVNAKYNGAFYLAGLSENDQDNNRWDTAFLNGPVQTFLDVFEAPVIPSGPPTGSFAWAVLSKAFTPPSTPIGTAFEVFKAVASDRVASQRRRRQKIRGWANSP